jgi:hypothetical protein
VNECKPLQMGRHEEALEHAEKAIMQLQAEWDSSARPAEDHPTNKSFLAMVGWCRLTLSNPS